MLRAVKIFIEGEKIYDQNYGKSLDEESFEGAFRKIMKEAFRYPIEEIKYHDFYKYRITYLPVINQKLLFLFISDLSDKFEHIEKEISRCRKEFMAMFSGVLGHSIDPKTFSIFDPAVESIHKNLRPKISLVGFSGVGKTTITKLIRAEEIPTKHIPTITGDIATIKIGNLHFHLWDFAGQEQFSFLWNNFVHGSDAVLTITDSTLENVEKSKYFIELIKKEAPYAHQAVIGNKQDLPEALPLVDLERILNVKTYSMVATDSTNRDKMITIIADILEMSAEVSPLLKPLIERDRKLEAAEKALENGDFSQAIRIFMDVADLCLTLGDDVVSQEFQQKAMKIQNILKNVDPLESHTIEPVLPTEYSKPAEPQNMDALIVEKPMKTPQSFQEVSPILPPASQAQSSLPPIAKSSEKETSNLDQLNMMLKGLSSTSTAPKPKIRKPPAIEYDQASDTRPETSKLSSPSPRSSLPSSSQSDLQQGSPSSPPSTLKLPTPPPVRIQTTEMDASMAKTPTPSPTIASFTSSTSSTTPEIKRLITQPPSSVPPAPSPVSTSPRKKEEIEHQILDLKLKSTDISKKIIDLDMENIMGKISNAKFEDEQKKLQDLELSVKTEIKTLEELLK